MAHDLIGRLRKTAATKFCTYATPDVAQLLNEAADALETQPQEIAHGWRGELGLDLLERRDERIAELEAESTNLARCLEMRMSECGFTDYCDGAQRAACRDGESQCVRFKPIEMTNQPNLAGRESTPGIVESTRRGALVDGVVRVIHHSGGGCGAFRRQWLEADDWAIVTCGRCLKQAGKPMPPVKDAPLPEGVRAVSAAIPPPPKEDKW